MKFVLFSLLVVLAECAEWSVLQDHFSSVTIGLAFRDENLGWTSYTNGGGLPVIVKTIDGGLNWTEVNSSGSVLIPLAFAVTDDAVASTGLSATAISSDGENFDKVAPAYTAQDLVALSDGTFVQMGIDGPCFFDGTKITACKKVPFTYPDTGRYIASPSDQVLFVTAGQWPQSPEDGNDDFELSDKHLSRHIRATPSAMLRRRTALKSTDPPAGYEGNYTAEIWKSEDGGDSWTQLFIDTGNYYFNDIDCFDTTHCVAVAEGFAEDGSNSPGARVFSTTDGTHFEVSHLEATTGAESLMAVAMLSATEHWAGGTTESGGLAAPLLALHSTDAGSTYTNEGSSVRGQSITAMSFVSPTCGYATSIDSLQLASILAFK